MSFRRLLPCLALLLLAVSALAQMTAQDKRDVLHDMDEVLTQEAFVPGVDLEHWETFLDNRRDALNEAETPWEFANVINRALSEFGVSHIHLSVARRRGNYRGAFQQQDNPFQTGPVASGLGTVRWLTQDAAVLRVRDFDRAYDPDRIETAFDEVRKAKYLVIDLRSNPGGELGNLKHFLTHLLPPGTAVGTFVSRRSAEEFEKAGLGDGKDPVAIAAWSQRKFRVNSAQVLPFQGKVAVMIDGRSASASEIVASAAREVLSSPLVGEPSAGAVLMSTFGRLSHGFEIQFPISDYVSIKGERLEGHPLTPDVDLTEAQGPNEDAAQVALSRLKAG